MLPGSQRQQVLANMECQADAEYGIFSHQNALNTEFDEYWSGWVPKFDWSCKISQLFGNFILWNVKSRILLVSVHTIYDDSMARSRTLNYWCTGVCCEAPYYHGIQRVYEGQIPDRCLFLVCHYLEALSRYMSSVLFVIYGQVSGFRNGSVKPLWSLTPWGFNYCYKSFR